MHQTLKSFFCTFRRLAGVFILFLLPTSVYADAPGTIVVSIKPLYSLVAHLTEGISKPVLLMKQMQSPHHYNMRPSERRLLANAKMIIWTGPQMESYLNKIIEQQASSTTIVSAMQSKNLKLLNKRDPHSHDRDEHTSSASSEKQNMVDPHIWLSTANAIAISKQITEALVKNDPSHAGSYKNNLQRLIRKIEQTKKFIQTTLKTSRQPFIAYHDAFQYFEHENNLNYIDSISSGDETGTGLKHLREIKNHIDSNNIQCLVYQEPEPAIVRSLTKQTTINAIALDPLGLKISDSKNAWFELMRQLAVNFSHCLLLDE